MLIMGSKDSLTSCLTIGFRCHPNYANDLREQYARQLMLIAKSELLSDLISQIIGRTVKVGKLDPELHLEIMDTDYALS